MMQGGASVFFHDLVRNDFRSRFFNRLDYYPGNPSGKKYHWFAQAAAVSLVLPHGEGKIVRNDLNNGVCVSRHEKYVYVTIINSGSVSNNVIINMEGVTLDRDKPMELRSFRAASSECCFFDYYTDQTRMRLLHSSRDVRIESSPFSIVGARIYVR
jgi:hypothetical protein